LPPNSLKGQNVMFYYMVLCKRSQELRVCCKMWFENERSNYIFGEMPFELFRYIDDSGTLEAAVKKVGCSIAFARKKIREIEVNVGERIIEGERGGQGGGGKTKLTEKGKELLEKYDMCRERLKDFIDFEMAP